MTQRKTAVATAFGQAAAGYDQAADLQREVACRLAQCLAAAPLPPRPRVLEVGCGTGFLGQALLARAFAPAFWLLTDLAPPMVRQCRARLPSAPAHHFLVMDGERPCLTAAAGAGFDLVCSSLAFQWFEDLERSLAGLAALLKPGGLLAYAVPLAGTFAEWRQAHAALGLRCGVPTYATAEALARLWPPGGGGAVTSERVTRRYADGRAFLHDLKRIGAQVPRAGHRPLSAGELRQVLRRVETVAGVEVTYHIGYGSFIRGE